MLADISPEALRVAKDNIQRCGLGARALAIEADALAPAPPRLGSFDLITCNPPYIPTAEIRTLDASVRAHEPRMALDGGEDGLKFYRAVLGGWKSLLRQSGWESGRSPCAISSMSWKSPAETPDRTCRPLSCGVMSSPWKTSQRE